MTRPPFPPPGFPWDIINTIADAVKDAIVGDDKKDSKEKESKDKKDSKDKK